MGEHEWNTTVREPLTSAAPDATVLVLVEGEAGTARPGSFALALPYWSAGRLPDKLAQPARAEAATAASAIPAIQAAVAANKTTVLLSVGDPDGHCKDGVIVELYTLVAEVPQPS
ncbi:hypothetical protein [Streptomyces sp.]|uniref:hypothetical protein n=1 Tax=Streptomyces sp. TaxID=1931 RepID=UPI002D782F8B|nr:hypothetical protein [Streptomyces sp.]HET6353944.1 hypothetical protein [Streptomyces sp.]